MLQKTFPQVDLCAVDECDPIKGGSCSRHGPTMGHRGLRRHEESLHGELKKLKLHHTYYYTYYSWRLRCTTLKKIRGPSWQAWNPTKGGSVWVWFPWFNLMPWNIVAQHQPYQCNFISGTAYHSKIVTAPLHIHLCPISEQSIFCPIMLHPVYVPSTNLAKIKMSFSALHVLYGHKLIF